MLTNKSKTKLNGFCPFEEMSPQGIKKNAFKSFICSQLVTAVRSFARQNRNRQKYIIEFKIIIFYLNYLTVYTKTIINIHH